MTWRHALMQRALDLAAADPTLRAVHGATGVLARLGARARHGASDLVGACGVATRADHARLDEELARLEESTRALSEALERFERRLPGG